MRTDYRDRLTYRTPGERLHPLMYIMLYNTLVTGLAFTFFGFTVSVQSSIIFQLTQTILLGYAVVPVWGMCALFAVLFAFLNIIYRKRALGLAGTYLGVGVYLYAFFLYMVGGFWYQMLATITPLAMWVWHYHRVQKWYREVT